MLAKRSLIERCSSELVKLLVAQRDVGQYEQIKTTFTWPRWMNPQRRAKKKYRRSALDKLIYLRRIVATLLEQLRALESHTRVRELAARAVPIVVDSPEIEDDLRAEAFLRRWHRRDKYLRHLGKRLDRRVILCWSSATEYLVIEKP